MIEGKIYLAGRSDSSPAKLCLQADTFQLYINNQSIVSGAIEQLRIADRLGNIARKITLPEGDIFETTDNDAVDAAIKASTRPKGFMSIVHILERNMLLAIFSIFITAAVLYAGFKWGLPAASNVIAQTLPASTNKVLSNNVLEFLDEHIFEESKLDAEQQQQITQHFTQNIVPLYQDKDAPQFTLHFRLWPLGKNVKDRSIPNALALPSGDIIVTDRFIELAQSQDEIDIVLLHEMGHVIKRHSLEQVIEGSAIAVAVSLAFGDVTWLADMGVGMGSFLISSFYSRSHEAEADLFAYEHSLQAGINPASLGLILNRMEQDMSFSSCDADETEQQCTDMTKAGDNEEKGISNYLSTHPSSAERTAMGKRYQTCFEQGLVVCLETNHK